MLVEQLINDQITEEDFLAAYKRSSQEEQAVLLSELLETYGRSPDPPEISVRKALLRLQKDVLDNYGRNKLSSAADTVIETLFEQLRLDRVAKAEFRDGQEVETSNGFLKKLTLNQIVEPQVHRVIVLPNGDRYVENLGVYYYHEFIKITPDEEIRMGDFEQGGKFSEIGRIRDTLEKWGFVDETATWLYDIMTGERTGRTKLIVTTYGPDSELTAVGTAELYSGIDEQGKFIEHPYITLEYNVGNPDGYLPLNNNPDDLSNNIHDGTLLGVERANLTAILHYIANKWAGVDHRITGNVTDKGLISITFYITAMISWDTKLIGLESTNISRIRAL